jgi:hypothetical protein
MLTGQGLNIGGGGSPTGVLTLKGLSLQVAIGERGSQPQGVTTDEGGDIRRSEGQGCPCDAVQEARHPVGYSAQGLQETEQARDGERPCTLQPGFPTSEPLDNWSVPVSDPMVSTILPEMAVSPGPFRR